MRWGFSLLRDFTLCTCYYLSSCSDPNVYMVFGYCSYLSTVFVASWALIACLLINFIRSCTSPCFSGYYWNVLLAWPYGAAKDLCYLRLLVSTKLFCSTFPTFTFCYCTVSSSFIFYAKNSSDLMRWCPVYSLLEGLITDELATT